MHWKTMLTFTLTLVFLSVLATESEWSKLRNKHHYKNLTDQKLIRVAGRHDIELFKRLLGPILKERVPDTPGIREVRDFIVNDLLKLNWHVDLDSFDEDTPFGLKNFVNIIATQNPSARRHLVIACHYDSKYMPGDQPFIGATDSAVPCAMMLHLAHQLNSSMNEESDVSLQLLFLDGEEAFVRWTAKDSLYGARHLAERWQNTPYPADSDSTELDRIDMFILLDLIGAINPKFHNWFSSTSKHFQRLADTEQRLNKAQRNLRSNGDESLLMAPYRQNYFSRSLYHGDPYIEDDHIPFLRRNVPVIHLISAPFPPVWHTPADNESNLDYDTIQNLNTILRVFVTEYLHLQA